MLGAALLVLAGCGGPDPAPAPLRDPQARISSAVLFSPEAFAGDWRVLESGTPGCAGAAQGWAWRGDGRYDLSGTDCTGARPARLAGQAVLTGPGARLTPTEGFGRAPIWVLWVDQDYRIAVLGTPDGSFGMVIGRDGIAARDDLRQAAREVLSFNGYRDDRIGR